MWQQPYNERIEIDFMRSIEDFPQIPLAEIKTMRAELCSLWHDYHGEWHTAHELVDGVPGVEAAWVHAYLHRKEGDIWNADYWYRRAEKKRPEYSLEQEWKELLKYFLVT